ncbi:MAG: glucose-6-phosphate isomerase [Flavobacteriaceae bacterium]|nr:glucose-6-phosphate isomerase [Flavobacteriaceae bacterium]
MALKNANPLETTAWEKLVLHYNDIKDVHMKKWFEEDASRAKTLCIKWEDFYVDFSKNRITEDTLKLLYELVDEIDLKDAIQKYFSGDIINQTEQRAVLHTALRDSTSEEILVNNENIIPKIRAAQNQLKAFSNSIVSGQKTGYTNKAFTDIVNIGIGGSDLGPAMVVEALSYYKNHLNTHFVSNVDGDHVNEVIKGLNPETTLFIIVSKTFTTQETLSNANFIRNWFLSQAPEEAVKNHFVAVSTNIEKVKEFGIDETNIFPMWDWVGGRFSLWSTVGLSICLSVGYENFEHLLEGAHQADTHFRNEDFNRNIPVILALIGIFYNNFFNAETEAIIPYSQYLNQFATYLQQANMESNGKGIDRNGVSINYQTGPIIWGEPGTNAQHAFFQLIHQGTKLIPTDFIGFGKSLHGNQDQQDKLMANFFAQTEALLKGKSMEDVVNELQEQNVRTEDLQKIAVFKVFEGNRPTNTILIDKLTPKSLGKLIAFYEHKIFVQGIVWNVYSYDQFGVELGKQLAGKILSELNEDAQMPHDGSTQNLIARYKSLK